MLKRIFLSLLGFKFFVFLPVCVGMVVSALYFLQHNPGVSPGKALMLASLATGYAGNYLGFYIQPIFSRVQAALIPNFSEIHAAFALSVNGVIALVVTGVMLAGPWSNVSFVSVFSILWAYGSLWTCIGYLGRGSARVGSIQEMWWLWGPQFAVVALVPWKMLYPFLAEFLSDTPGATAKVLLAASIAVNVLVGMYVLRAPRTGGDVTRVYLSEWATRGPLAQKRFWNRNLNALDSIRHPVSTDFFSHVRHFRLNRQLPSHAFLLGLLLAGLVLGAYQSTRQQADLADTTILWTTYFLLVPFVPLGMRDSRGVHFRLLSRLPLRRQDMVARQGVATLMLAVDMWLTFVAAAFLAALLPSGVGLKAFPSAGFLIASFTTHLAVFGIMALITSVPISAGWKATAALPLVAALAVTAWLAPSPLYPVVSALLAIGLIWVSFHVLCTSEIS